MITSTSNAQIKELAKLQKKSRLRDEKGIFLVEGPRMTEEIPAERIEKVYASESFAKKNKEFLEKLQAHGSINLDGHTSSTKKIMCATAELFDRIVDKNLLVRRLNITANHVVPEADAPVKNGGYEQLDLFTDFTALEAQRKREKAELDREKKMQQAMLIIKKKYGKNAILKGMNLEEGATAKDRNEQIGGHKA